MGGESQIIDEKSLGQRLQEARQAANLTQQELCQKSGLAYSTLAKIERGAIKSPSIFTICSIAETLHTSLDELVGLATAANAVAASGNAGLPSLAPPVFELPKQQSKSGVRFVYFDINGCLVRFFHRAFTAIAEEGGVPADVIETTFWHYNDAVCRGEMSIDDFNSTLSQRFGLHNFDWRTYYLDAVDPIQEMRELLSWAAEKYHVGLLSNIMPGLIEELMNTDKLPRTAYSAIIDSSVVHAIKPEPEIYQVAQTQSGFQPGEILLIDDSRANLMAAEHLGWHVLWFDDYRPTESIERIREALEPAETAVHPLGQPATVALP